MSFGASFLIEWGHLMSKKIITPVSPSQRNIIGEITHFHSTVFDYRLDTDLKWHHPFRWDGNRAHKKLGLCFFSVESDLRVLLFVGLGISWALKWTMWKYDPLLHWQRHVLITRIKYAPVINVMLFNGIIHPSKCLSQPSIAINMTCV